MCGIVGYIGSKRASDIVLRGLKRLEYRGYDSAGMAVFSGQGFQILKTVGKVAQLEALEAQHPLEGTLAIGHTRWATHGGVTEANAHPHRDQQGRVVMIHNGIFENFVQVRQELQAQGVEFQSDTDTEVGAQLLAQLYTGDPIQAICQLYQRFRGAFALVMAFDDRPDELYCLRRGAPLVVALGDGEGLCASDVPAIVEYADRVIFLEEGEICRLTREGASFWDLQGVPHSRETMAIDVDPAMIDKAGYPHFMLKEINEQGTVLRQALFGRCGSEAIDLSDEWGLSPQEARSFQRLHLVACGTSYYAALAAERVLERYLGLAITVDIASEYRYRPLKVDRSTLVLLVSQSGETSDTLAAARHAIDQGAWTVAVTNNGNSSLAREAKEKLLLKAGIEIGVAATKTFMAQLATLILAGFHLAKLRGELPPQDEKRLASELQKLPYKVESTLELREAMKQAAQRFAQARDFLFLGRGISFPVALEGALKLKEISYIHAEAYAAGEMKHGPIALLDSQVPVVALAPRDDLLEKTLSNVEETRARQAPVMILGTQGALPEGIAEVVVELAATEPELTPFVTVVPLQLFAYESAVLRGCDIDQPRNLAKSVTVE